MGRGRFNGSYFERGGGAGGSADLKETCTADSSRWSWANQREV